MKNAFLTAVLLLGTASSFSPLGQPTRTSTRSTPCRLYSTAEAETNAVSPIPEANSEPVAPATSVPPSPVSNQPKYGVSEALTDTYVRCGRCATSFCLKAEDLGPGKGRRVACSVCDHSWFQTPDRLFNLNDGHELVPLPETDLKRIGLNIKAGRDPDFLGEAKFYVGNLDFSVTEDDLRQVFSEQGDVGGVSLVVGPDGRSRGFAFVTMLEKSSADKCMELDGLDLKGRNINVKPPNN